MREPQYATKRELEALRKEVKRMIKEATKKPAKVVKRRKKSA